MACNCTSNKQALADLKARYAREDILIQVYVRELLTIILNKDSKTLTYLYDNISTQFCALETLGVTQDGYSSFILPMVESALPIDTLRAWERARPSNMTDELKTLLDFGWLIWVESDQRIKMATDFTHEQQESKYESTACALVAGINNKAIDKKCIWCNKNHLSIECYKLAKLTLSQRIEHITKKKACMICLKVGHYSKVCKFFVQC